MSSSGFGVVEHPSGLIFFAPGVWTGECGVFLITKVKGRVGEAVLVELTNPSPDRIEPDCIYAQRHTQRDPVRGNHHPSFCGGCPWMFMTYGAQLAAKQHRIESALETFIPQSSVAPIHPAQQQYGYRNRAQLKTDGVRLGYMSSGSNEIVDVEDCLVLSDHNRETLRALRYRGMQEFSVKSKNGGWQTIDIDESVDASSALVGRRLPFKQPNSAQNDFMGQWLRTQMIDLFNDDERSKISVVELFAGSGNFTEIIFHLGFKKITTVEVVEEAVEAMRQRLPDIDAIQADLFVSEIAPGLRRSLAEAHLLVMDPPRAGYENLPSALNCAPNLETVLYVSCDLATFARDARTLVDAGFSVNVLQPLDQLPHTPHIELMARFEKKH
ncbi:MAG: class I SAM-dependent RNA methyltransferase [bacterium]